MLKDGSRRMSAGSLGETLPGFSQALANCESAVRLAIVTVPLLLQPGCFVRR
jgi:hypothetical protein